MLCTSNKPKEQTKMNRRKIKPTRSRTEKCAFLFVCYCCCSVVEQCRATQYLFHRRQTMALWLYLTQTPRTWSLSRRLSSLSHIHSHIDDNVDRSFPFAFDILFFTTRFSTLFAAGRIKLKPTPTTTDQFTILRCTINTYLGFSLLLSECDF